MHGAAESGSQSTDENHVVDAWRLLAGAPDPDGYYALGDAFEKQLKSLAGMMAALIVDRQNKYLTIGDMVWRNQALVTGWFC